MVQNDRADSVRYFDVCTSRCRGRTTRDKTPLHQSYTRLNGLLIDLQVESKSGWFEELSTRERIFEFVLNSPTVVERP